MSNILNPTSNTPIKTGSGSGSYNSFAFQNDAGTSIAYWGVGGNWQSKHFELQANGNLALSGLIQLKPPTNNAEVSIGFSANTDYSGTNFVFGRATWGLSSDYIALGASTASSNGVIQQWDRTPPIHYPLHKHSNHLVVRHEPEFRGLCFGYGSIKHVVFHINHIYRFQMISYNWTDLTQSMGGALQVEGDSKFNGVALFTGNFSVIIGPNGRLLVGSELDVYSDLRLKEQVEELDDQKALDVVEATAAKKFRFKSNPGIQRRQQRKRTIRGQRRFSIRPV
ncbi:hypothetical protein HDV00_000317, partial [Rhizophlyctis rosea]